MQNVKLKNTKFIDKNKSIRKQFYFLDFLKIICIIFVVIDNCNLNHQIKMLYGEPFWVGQAIPLFLLITSFLLSASYEYKNISTISDCYKLKYLLNRVLRFLIPFIIAFAVEEICFVCVTKQLDSQFFIRLLLGGDGPGAYYIGICFQIIAFFPLIYFLTKKYGFKSVIACFVLTLLWDLFCWGVGMDDNIYKRIIFRYVFILSCGIYIFHNIHNIFTKLNFLVLITTIVVGALFITLVYYFNIQMHVSTKWFQTCELSNLFVVPIFWLLVRYINMNKQKFWMHIGRATFNIFLTQKVFYFFYLLGYLHFINNQLIQAFLLNELIIFPVGWIFWFGEHKLTSLICNKINGTI